MPVLDLEVSWHTLAYIKRLHEADLPEQGGFANI